ncbi:MAG: hypothetical protein ABIO29_08685 [Sphingomicrobium sp.]
MVNSGGHIERLIDFGVAGLFAIACAFPAFMLLPAMGQSALAVAGLLAVIAFGTALRVLRRVDRSPRQVVQFDLMPMPQFPALEPLELRPSDVFTPAPTPAPQALELDDELTALSPDSRVVQLFGIPSQTTAGELAVRIERHLAHRDAPVRTAPNQLAPDASGELFEALDQLRASLR